MRRATVLVLALAAVGSACGTSSDAIQRSTPAASSATETSQRVESTTTPTVDTTSPPPSSTEVVATATSTEPTSSTWVDSALGRVVFTLPVGAGPDPLPEPVRPDFVVGFGRWVVQDCCRLGVTLQNVKPLVPADELLTTFESARLTWNVYDIGPRDGTVIMATATRDELSILVGAQSLSGQTSTRPSPAEVVEQVTRSILRVVPAPDISADLESPLCRELAPLVDGLVDAPLVPVGARMVGIPDEGCEILYAIPSYSPEVVIGRIPQPTSAVNDCLICQRTEDGDETSVHWDTGSIAYIDPTGVDLFNLSTDAHVVVQRTDGSRLYVSTIGPDDYYLAARIAQAFDNRLG
jgi:hypothetical protein